MPIALTQSFLNIQISFAETLAYTRNVGARIEFKAITRSVLQLHIVREKSEIPRANLAGVYPAQNACSIKFHIHRAPPVFVVVCIGLSPGGGPDITHPIRPRESPAHETFMMRRIGEEKKPRFYPAPPRSMPPISATVKDVNRARSVR